MNSLGDLATLFLSNRLQSDLRSKLQSASEAATTGIQPNKTEHLTGNTFPLSLLERKSQLLEQHKLDLAEMSIFTKAAQSVLERITSNVDELSRDLAPSSQLLDPDQITILASSAETRFEDVVSALNTEVAGKSVFGGAMTATPPLPSGEVMFSQIQTAVAGLSDVASIEAVVSDWFDNPAGLYETSVYQGSQSTHLQFQTDTETTVAFDLRADSAPIKNTLKALALGALTASPSVTLTTQNKNQLLAASAVEMHSVASSLAYEQGRLGLIDATVADAQSRVSRDLSALQIDRLSLIGTDQFEEVTRLEAMQQQLDIMYRLAARTGQTSLAQYLR